MHNNNTAELYVTVGADVRMYHSAAAAAATDVSDELFVWRQVWNDLRMPASHMQ